MALETARSEFWGKDVAIHTDSLSSLHSIMNLSNNDNIQQSTMIQNIIIELATASEPPPKITLHWIPSHVGIPGNTHADTAANQAIKNEVTYKSIPITQGNVKTKARIILKQKQSRTMASLKLQSDNYYRFLHITKGGIPLVPLPGLDHLTIRTIRYLRYNYTLFSELRGRILLCPDCQSVWSIEHYLLECSDHVEATALLQDTAIYCDEDDTDPSSERAVLGILRHAFCNNMLPLITFIHSHPMPPFNSQYYGRTCIQTCTEPAYTPLPVGAGNEMGEPPDIT